MAHHYLTQTWTGTPAGDLTNALTNASLTMLFSNGAGGCDATIGDAAIDDAEADADSILGPSFTVPVSTLSTAARILKRCVCDMTVYYGYERKPEFLVSGGDNPVQKRYDRATKILRDIKSGVRDLGTETAPKTANAGGTTYATELEDRFILDDITDGPF
ncbi:MAG: phage protein Gp36 family protein [Brevundimonas sp.]